MRPSTILGGIMMTFMIFGILMAALIAADREERGLIASGLCRADGETWYQPPPVIYCTVHVRDGQCVAWGAYSPAAYLRTHWVCEGGKSFWRRSDD